MNTGTWICDKSYVMDSIRLYLKKKAEKGQGTLSRKEANRTWREDILGILSEEDKKEIKRKRQERNRKYKEIDPED